MDKDGTVYNQASGQTESFDDSVSGSGVLEDTKALLHELLGLTHDRFRLAALETQRAGQSFVAMIMAGVMIAVLLNGAWLGLLAAGVYWLVENGVAASRAILLAVALNLLLALILFGVIRHKRRSLKFPATLRSLQPLPRSAGMRRNSDDSRLSKSK
jgi:uncharacterized membrane protein YqjE